MTRGSVRQRRKRGDLADVVRCVESDRESDVAGESIDAEPREDDVRPVGDGEDPGASVERELAEIRSLLVGVEAKAAKAIVVSENARRACAASNRSVMDIMRKVIEAAEKCERMEAEAERLGEKHQLLSDAVDLRIGKVRADMAAEDARARSRAQDAVRVSFVAFALAVACTLACVASRVMM